MTLADIQHEIGVRVNADPSFVATVLAALDSMLEMQLQKQKYGGCFYQSSLPLYTSLRISLNKIKRQMFPMYDDGPCDTKFQELSIHLGNSIMRTKELRKQMRLCGCADCRKEFER